MRFQAGLFALLFGFAVITMVYAAPANAQNIYNSQSGGSSSGGSSKSGLFSLFNKKKDSSGSKPIYVNPSNPGQQSGGGNNYKKPSQPYQYGMQHTNVYSGNNEFKKSQMEDAMNQQSLNAQAAAKNKQQLAAKMASYKADLYQQRMEDMKSYGVGGGSTGGPMSGSKGNVVYKVKKERKTNAPIRLFSNGY